MERWQTNVGGTEGGERNISLHVRNPLYKHYIHKPSVCSFSTPTQETVCSGHEECSGGQRTVACLHQRSILEGKVQPTLIMLRGWVGKGW